MQDIQNNTSDSPGENNCQDGKYIEWTRYVDKHYDEFHLLDRGKDFTKIRIKNVDQYFLDLISDIKYSYSPMTAQCLLLGFGGTRLYYTIKHSGFFVDYSLAKNIEGAFISKIMERVPRLVFDFYDKDIGNKDLTVSLSHEQHGVLEGKLVDRVGMGFGDVGIASYILSFNCIYSNDSFACKRVSDEYEKYYSNDGLITSINRTINKKHTEVQSWITDIIPYMEININKEQNDRKKKIKTDIMSKVTEWNKKRKGEDKDL